MPIQKNIHYCWFGGHELPEKEQKCIASWKKYLPGYKITLWNEDTVDLSECVYAQQAYERKQYAFVSDYVRAKVLYEFGGLYLDTDVKILKSFSNLLETAGGIVGFERKAFIGTAVIACQAKNSCIKELLDYYETHNFVQRDGSHDNIANVSILTDIMRNYGLKLNGEGQCVKEFTVYNREWFYPKKLNDNEFLITENTVAVHMCSNSWMTDRERKRGKNILWIRIARPILRNCRVLAQSVLGKERVRAIEIKIRNYLH